MKKALITIRKTGQNETTNYYDLLINMEFQCTLFANSQYPMPNGIYKAQLYYSPRFHKQVILIHIPKHSGVEIHTANKAIELSGCFATYTTQIKDFHYQSTKPFNNLIAAIKQYSEFNVMIC